MRRAVVAVIVTTVLAAGCAKAPDPGDLAAFCNLLETGTGLTSSPLSDDLDRLALVAPPAVRPTIEALQGRAKDFNVLLTESPPDLEALFTARFDPQARSERGALAQYAADSCGIATAESPSTRWNSFLQEEHQGEPWTVAVAGFETSDNRIQSASLTFAIAPEPIALVENACAAMSDFLLVDGAEPGGVQVLVGSVVVLEYDSPTGLCRLP